jgi:hypothetical protein
MEHEWLTSLVRGYVLKIVLPESPERADQEVGDDLTVSPASRFLASSKSISPRPGSCLRL